MEKGNQQNYAKMYSFIYLLFLKQSIMESKLTLNFYIVYACLGLFIFPTYLPLCCYNMSETLCLLYFLHFLFFIKCNVEEQTQGLYIFCEQSTN